jgi:hypothetical protein
VRRSQAGFVGDLVLDISGPADARPVIEMFFAPQAASPDRA